MYGVGGECLQIFSPRNSECINNSELAKEREREMEGEQRARIPKIEGNTIFKNLDIFWLFLGVV